MAANKPAARGPMGLVELTSYKWIAAFAIHSTGANILFLASLDKKLK
jgi:hypothetical protein